MRFAFPPYGPSSVSGGNGNTAYGGASVSGGSSNVAGGAWSSILGGLNQTAYSENQTIPALP
jgi:hypothetical protein